jgi:MscS family membrane protein
MPIRIYLLRGPGCVQTRNLAARHGLAAAKNEHETMILTKHNRFRNSGLRPWNHVVNIVFLLFLVLCSVATLSAQSSTPGGTPQATNTPASDPLGRETPRGTAMGLLKYGMRRDYATAARYLQPSRGQNLVLRAKELETLLPNLQGNIGLLSDDPAGIVEAGLQPGQVRAGVLAIRGETLDIILVRVDDPKSGKIWLVSKETVAQIPAFYAKTEGAVPAATNRILPSVLSERNVLGMSVAQWLGWLLSIPVCWLLVYALALLLSGPRRLWCKLRHLPFRSVWGTPLGTPLRCIIAILMHCVFVYLLDPPLLYRVYYFRFMAVLLVASFAWLTSTVMDVGFKRVINRTRGQRRGGESILVLIQRLSRILMIIITFVAALALFGINVTATLAGLGIGGLAVALGAQKTLENIMGGVSLLMDKALQIGDFCEIGGKFGTVEDIGLRSVKVRTLDQNLLVVPNMALAQMQFENMKTRPKLLINQKFSLRIETPVEQLRCVLNNVQGMLDGHPSVECGSRIRVNACGGAAFELELFAYVKTNDWPQFTEIRQDVVLKIAEIVEEAGARFAAPTRLTYVSRDGETTEEQTKAVGAT